jgi:arylsulfatase A-like enzyme
MEAVIENNRVIEHDPPINMLPRLTKRSVEYIDSRAGKQQPFFLYIPLGSPHTPILPSPDWKGKSKLGDYGDFVMQTDHVVGEVTAALRRNGFEKNTLVIFTSDNGPHDEGSDNGCSRAAGIGKLKQQGHLVSAHMRGSKADIWDGGHRIPFIVKWPGHVEPNSNSDQLICLTDLFATIAALTGNQTPDGTCEDSVSFLPALRSEPIQSTRKGVVHHSVSGHFAYRQNNWKLILAKGSGGWSSPRENQVPATAPVAQLYDLDKDPGEQNNLYDSQPDVATKLLAQLKEDVTNGRSTQGIESTNDVANVVLWKSVKGRKKKQKQE